MVGDAGGEVRIVVGDSMGVSSGGIGFPSEGSEIIPVGDFGWLGVVSRIVRAFQFPFIFKGSLV